MTSPVDVVARTVGGALAAGASTLGAARQRVKPFHPEGTLRRATLTRLGGSAASGVPWLDEAGATEVLVRVSRGIGLPGPLPDVQGLAIRVPFDGAVADILLASTGLGHLGRFVLMPTRTPTGRPLTSLLPYASPRGPLLLAASPDSERSFELLWATAAGSWHTFGRLELGAAAEDDPAISFDPVINVVPGLSHYSWIRRIREPAYWAARRRSNRQAVPPAGPGLDGA